MEFEEDDNAARHRIKSLIGGRIASGIWSERLGFEESVEEEGRRDRSWDLMENLAPSGGVYCASESWSPKVFDNLHHKDKTNFQSVI